MQLHILRSIQCEHHAHILQGLGDDDTTVEIHTAPCPIASRHGRFGALGGCDIQGRIHRIARELNIRTILDYESLQWNDGQRVFHLTIGKSIATRQA